MSNEYQRVCVCARAPVCVYACMWFFYIPEHCRWVNLHLHLSFPLIVLYKRNIDGTVAEMSITATKIQNNDKESV